MCNGPANGFVGPRLVATLCVCRGIAFDIAIHLWAFGTVVARTLCMREVEGSNPSTSNQPKSQFGSSDGESIAYRLHTKLCLGYPFFSALLYASTLTTKHTFIIFCSPPYKQLGLLFSESAIFRVLNGH